MKKCFKCSEEKPFDFFCKNKNESDGYSRQCKICAKEYHNRNRNLILENNKLYYQDNKESIKVRDKEYRNSNKEIIKERGREYYQKNKEEISIKKSKYRNDNKESIKIQKREYYLSNKESIKVKHKEYKRIKRKDHLFRLKSNIRSLIGSSVKSKGYIKKSNTELILGCELIEFKKYLESKFESCMNWENYGLYNGELNYGWDIDHIIPTCSADNEEDIIKLNNYINLQPLCSYINRVVKREKIIKIN